MGTLSSCLLARFSTFCRTLLAAALIVVASLMAVAYIWRVVEVGYFTKPPEGAAAVSEAPISMLIPEVVGFKLTGELQEGATATDLVLTVVQMLREKGVAETLLGGADTFPDTGTAGAPDDTFAELVRRMYEHALEVLRKRREAR